MKTVVDCSLTSAPLSRHKTWHNMYNQGHGITPSLVLDFERGFYGTDRLKTDTDDLITFSRTSSKTAIGPSGGVVTYGADEMAFDWSVGKRGLILGPGDGSVAPDIATVPLGAWWNTAQGSIIGTYTIVTANGGYDRIVEVNDTTSVNRISLLYNAGQGRNVFGVYANSSAQAVLLGPNTDYVVGTTAQFAVGFDENDFGYSHEGNATMTDSAGIVPSSVSQLQLGAGAGGANRPTIILHQLIYFDQKLSNTALLSAN